MLRGIRSGAQEQNKLEIDLALRTLEFFGRLTRTKKIEVGADTRTVAACLCDWQDRWAQPILMPLTGKMDMEEPLQTPRPARALLSLGYIYPVEGVATIAADDGLVHEGKAYCFAGKATWQSLVQQGKLTGADSVAPQRSAFCWLQKLFNLFATVKFDEDEAAVARRIASCWYYTATECNFDESDENPENDKVEPIAPQQLLGMLFAQAPSAAAGGDDDGDDDDEGEESLDDDDEEGDEHDEGDDDGEDDDDEEEEEEQDVQPPPEKKAASTKSVSFAVAEGTSLTNELMKDADADEDEDEEFEPADDEEEEEEEDDEPEEETEQAKEIRTAVLKGVEAVNAYLPPPSTDMLYFKRMLLRMQATDEISKRWFPWGVPPWEPLKTAIKSSDPLLQNYATEILRLFAQQAGGN